MNAMPEYRVRGQHAAFLIAVGVIARAHVKMMNFFQFFAVLGEVRLQISFEPGGKLRRAAHHFFRTSDGKARAERIFEPAFFSPMPLSAKSLALQQRN